MRESSCIALIGMPGVGKSAVGALLAARLGFTLIDTDWLLESIYARRLQDVVDTLPREEVLDAEAELVMAISGSRCVIATGGSVIYRPQAIAHLQKLGMVVHLYAPLETIRERIELNPERGICFAPGQCLEDLYEERMKLYPSASSLEINTELLRAEECAELIGREFKHFCG